MESKLKIGAITLGDHGEAARGRIELSALVGEDEGWKTEIIFHVPFHWTPETTIESLREQGVAVVAQLLREEVLATLQHKLPGLKGHLKFIDGPLMHTIGTVTPWQGTEQPQRPFVQCEGNFYQVVNWSGAATEDAAAMDEYIFTKSKEECYDVLGCNFQLNGKHQKPIHESANSASERSGGPR